MVPSPWNPRLSDLNSGHNCSPFYRFALTAWHHRRATLPRQKPRPLPLGLACPAPARFFRPRPSGLPWQRVRAPRSAAARAGPRLDRGPRPGGHSCHRRRHLISSPSLSRLASSRCTRAGGRGPFPAAPPCADAEGEGAAMRPGAGDPLCEYRPCPTPAFGSPCPDLGHPWKCRVPAHSSLAGTSPQLPCGVLSDLFYTTSELRSQDSSSLWIPLYSCSGEGLLDPCSSGCVCVAFPPNPAGFQIRSHACY